MKAENSYRHMTSVSYRPPPPSRPPLSCPRALSRFCLGITVLLKWNGLPSSSCLVSRPKIPFVANRPDVQDAVNAAHERLGMVSGYLRDVVRETVKFRTAGMAMAKASEDLATYLM